MKMAKASEADFKACFELERILRDVERGYYPHPIDEEATTQPEPLWFDPDDKDHLRAFHDKVMEIVCAREVNITRVIYGFKVAVDNDVFDPAADTLEWHPDLLRAVEARKAKAEPAEERKPSHDLSAIGQRLRTQDNRCTQSPMFIVQERQSFGVEPSEGDEDVWLDEDWSEVDAETAARLNELGNEFEWDLTEEQQAELKRHTKRGIKHFWEFRMAAFTEEGCKEYLRLNGHNLNKPRIYVESFHRCPEMLAIREFLMAQTETKEKSQEGGGQ